MFYHQFFKQSLNILKTNKRLIENTAFLGSVCASAYYYPECSKRYTEYHMTLFYNRLSEEEKIALKQDPEKEKEFIQDCQSRLRIIIGPPD